MEGRDSGPLTNYFWAHGGPLILLNDYQGRFLGSQALPLSSLPHLQIPSDANLQFHTLGELPEFIVFGRESSSKWTEK